MVGKSAPTRDLPVHNPPSHSQTLTDSGAALQPFRPGVHHRGLDFLLGHLVPALIALVGIGGATRVMQAGLACPDWPLCYGTLLPGRQMNLQVFLEWFHRLDAFLVGIALLTVGAVSLFRRRDLPRWLPWMAGLALALVIVQGGLGALTVLGLLEASTVTLHLLTALVLVLLISGTHQALRTSAERLSSGESPLQACSPLPFWWMPLLALSTLTLFAQCALGGAMASRWAASLCLDDGIGCHWLLLHRLGAWPTLVALVLPALASLALPSAESRLRTLAWFPAGLVPCQVGLGLLTLRLQLAEPMVTVAHQLLAALLVALLGALWGRSLVSFSSVQAVPVPPSLEMAHG